MGDKGIVASTAGLAILLNEGIGDTIRVSLTPEPGGAARAGGGDRPAGPPVARPALVHAPGLGVPGLRPHDLDVLPGDGAADPGLPARTGCPPGASGTRASRTCASRSWAASSTGPANPSTPTSGSRCRARSRSRSRRCSSTASSIGRSAGTGWWTSSSPSSRRTSSADTGRRRRPPRRRGLKRFRAGADAARRTPRARVYTPARTQRPLRVTWVTPTFFFSGGAAARANAP